jgi:hypothetical protein
MKTIRFNFSNIITVLLVLTLSCTGQTNNTVHNGQVNINAVDEEKNTVIWEQICIGNPFNLEMPKELMQKLKKVTTNIVNDTIIINKEYSAKFKIEQKPTALFFSRYEGIGDFIVEFLSNLNIDIQSNVTILNFSSYSNNNISSDYLIANSVVCVDNYLFIVYKQNYVLIYKKNGQGAIQTALKTTDISDIHSDKNSENEIIPMSIGLPFDFLNYCIWYEKYESGETEEHPYGYVISLEDNPELKLEYLNIYNDNTIESYSMLNTNNKSFQTYFLFYNARSRVKIITVSNNQIIDRLSIGNEKENYGWKEISFVVSPQLDITVYENTFKDNMLIKQNKIENYRIDDDGQIIRE